LPGDHREVTTIKRLFYAGNMAELFAASVSHRPSLLNDRIDPGYPRPVRNCEGAETL
jgi:hypothetical protein